MGLGARMHREGSSQQPMAGTRGEEEFGRQLLVKGFPSWLGREDKESLLSHFGAVRVDVMPTSGRMRNSLFATFSRMEEAKLAMAKLHQLELFGSRLVVEFARPQQTRWIKHDRWQCNTSGTEVEADHSDETEKTKTKTPLPPLPPSPPPPPPHSLTYQYPSPSPTILHNISNALSCVPKFYIQVLHLMNRMNLPPPFGPPTPVPPLPPDLTQPFPPHPTAGQTRGHENGEDEEEGSEIESDEDMKYTVSSRLSQPKREVKRRTLSFKPIKGAPPSKKRKIGEEDELTPLLHLKTTKLQLPSQIVLPSTPVNIIMQHEPLAQVVPQPPSIQDEPTVALQERASQDTVAMTPAPPMMITREQELRGPLVQDEVDKSGLLVSEQMDEEGEEEERSGELKQYFASREELINNRIPEHEKQELSAFRNYSRGEPSLRLYIKNLSKQATEEDLRYIYGRFIDWESEQQKTMFDVRVMQTGRMKGQAFVGLPSEQVAITALEDTHGYLLHGKPLVVQFARSSRPKDKT